MQQRRREHDEQMRQQEVLLEEARRQRNDRIADERLAEARRQLHASEARLAEMRRQNDDDNWTWGQARDYLFPQTPNPWLLGAVSVGAAVALASPLLFPQDGQGKTAEINGSIETINAEGKLGRMTLSQFISALFTQEIRTWGEPDDATRFNALRAELSSFVGSDRDIKESKHFRQFSQGDIKTMRETWPEIIRLQATLPPISVRDYEHDIPDDEDSAHGRFYQAWGNCVQGSGHILSLPVTPAPMVGGGRRRGNVAT
jgi:hypothetical protein